MGTSPQTLTPTTSIPPYWAVAQVRTRSQKRRPGSALCQAASTRASQASLARIVVRIASLGVVKRSSQGSSARAACKKASVALREMLAWRTRERSGSVLARMKSTSSGWVSEKVSIRAPRRPPLAPMTPARVEKSSMKLTAPELSTPAFPTLAPRGLRTSALVPTPPP
jgi:hypothetical protein